MFDNSCQSCRGEHIAKAPRWFGQLQQEAQSREQRRERRRQQHFMELWWREWWRPVFCADAASPGLECLREVGGFRMWCDFPLRYVECPNASEFHWDRDWWLHQDQRRKRASYNCVTSRSFGELGPAQKPALRPWHPLGRCKIPET